MKSMIPRDAPKGRNPDWAQRRAARERHRAMVTRRLAVLGVAAYGGTVLASFFWTRAMWSGRLETTMPAEIFSFALLLVSLFLSRRVPANKPRPAAAAGFTIVIWLTALSIAALEAEYNTTLGDIGRVAELGLVFSFIYALRFAPFTRTRVRAGAGALLVAVFLGTTALASYQPSSEALGGISFSSGITSPSTNGLALKLDVYAHGCGNIIAVVHVWGTTEFWKAHKASKGAIPVQLILPAESAHEAELYAVTNAADAVNDTLPGSIQPAFKEEQGADFPFSAHAVRVAKYGKYEVITGTVDRRWLIVKAPIGFVFKPHWTTYKELKTCYVQVPPLVEWPTDGAPVWRHVNATGLALPSVAVTTLHFEGSSDGSPVPQPAGSTVDSYTWTCGVDITNDKASPYQGTTTPTYPITRYREKSSFDTCEAIAPLADASAPALHDLIVLFAGGLVSLGLALLVSTNPTDRLPSRGA